MPLLVEQSGVQPWQRKTIFTADEWNKVVQGVMVSGIAVTAAEPNGLFGTLKEAAASGSAMGAAKSDPAASALIKSVVAHMETPEGRTATRDALKQRFEGAKAKEISQRCVETLREVAQLVDRKAPDEAPGLQDLDLEHQQEGGGSLEGRWLPRLRRPASERERESDTRSGVEGTWAAELMA